MFTIVNEGSSLTIVNEGFETSKFLKTVVFEKKQSLEELKLLDIFLKTTQWEVQMPFRSVSSHR